MKKIRGRRALVTGAGSGIGRALALRLAAEGAEVCLADIAADKLEAVAAEIRATGGEVQTARVDLTQVDDVERLAQLALGEWGGVDLLVNNAGVAYYGVTHTMDDEHWDRVMAVNLLAPARLTRRLLPSLLEKPDCHVVNVASIFGLFAHRKTCAYHVTKFGMVGFSESLRAEYGRKGLGVTTVCPGFVSTNLFQSGATSEPDRPIRTPPKWVTTTPERVAAKTVRAVYRNRRLVLVTPLAYLMYYVKRFSPGFLDWLQQRW